MRFEQALQAMREGKRVKNYLGETFRYNKKKKRTEYLETDIEYTDYKKPYWDTNLACIYIDDFCEDSWEIVKDED